jgi:DHA1 family multidrug resistance protein-like MFS transporter
MPQWRRNVYVLFVSQLLSTAGFGIIFPFLPLYVKELGVATRGSVEFWSGMVFSSQGITMMIMAPIWGSFADRYGRKLMLVRATLGGAVILALMGFVQSAEQLTLLRAIQGLITGTLAAANALVAASSPRERSGESLGLVQTANWTGIAAGPVLGGVIGDAFGFRESFWITGTLLGLSGLAVLFLVHEEFTPRAADSERSITADYRAILRAPGMFNLYGLSFTRSLAFSVILPIAPLFVASLMQRESGVATITGIVMGVSAFAGALSAIWLGHLGDRIGHRRVLVGSTVAALIFYVPQPFVTSAWQLVILQACSGFAAGGMVPAIGALMNLWTPTGGQGATYGLDNSVIAGAKAIAPMVASGIAIVFGLRGALGAAVAAFGMASLLAVQVARQADVRAERVDSGRCQGSQPQPGRCHTSR